MTGLLKRLIALLLLPILLLSLAACGSETEELGFRTLAVLGTRHYSLIYRGGDRLAPQVDAAMMRLYRSGQLSTICVRWLGKDIISISNRPQATERPEETEAPEETDAAAPEPTEAPERTLIVGVEEDFDPMAFLANGFLQGMSIDIASALGMELGWKVSYQPISPAEVETQLASGNIDCALGFDPESVDTDDFTVGVGYLQSDIVLASRLGSAVGRVSELDGQRVGTVDDPAIAAAVRANEDVTRYASGATVYLSPRRCVSALDNGWCAAIAMDVIMLQHAL